MQEDGIGKFPDPDDSYAGLWFFTGRKHSTHTPMPMLLSSKGYALAVDTDARAVFALGSERPDAARFEAWEGTLDLQIFVGDGARGGTVAGEAARDALGHMVAWAGKPARPPLSIFAPWIDAIYGAANVRRVAQKLRSEGIAASAIWTEDWRGGDDTAHRLRAARGLARRSRRSTPTSSSSPRDLHGMGFAFLTYHNTFIDDKADIHDEAIAAGYAVKDATGGPYTFTGITFGGSKLLDLDQPGGRHVGEVRDGRGLRPRLRWLDGRLRRVAADRCRARVGRGRARGPQPLPGRLGEDDRRDPRAARRSDHADLLHALRMARLAARTPR